MLSVVLTSVNVTDRCHDRHFASNNILKKLIEKSRESHNHMPQPNSDSKRKRKRTQINACKINKQMHEKYIDQLSLSSLSDGITMLKGLKKHKNKEQGKTQHETPRNRNHKVTQDKNNTRNGW